MKGRHWFYLNYYFFIIIRHWDKRETFTTITRLPKMCKPNILLLSFWMSCYSYHMLWISPLMTSLRFLQVQTNVNRHFAVEDSHIHTRELRSLSHTALLWYRSSQHCRTLRTLRKLSVSTLCVSWMVYIKVKAKGEVLFSLICRRSRVLR